MQIKLDSESLYKVRRDIMDMQSWVAKNDPDSTNPLIKELVNSLMRTRTAVERIMIEQQN